MKICFYCDSIFTFGGVQRVLAVIAKSLSEHHQVTILTHDRPEQQDMDMYELRESELTFRYLSFPPVHAAEYLPCKIFSLLYKKKIIPQTSFTSAWYGRSSFPPSQRARLVKELNTGAYDSIIGVHAFLSLRLASIRHRLNAPQVSGWMHTSFDAFFKTPGFYLYEQRNQFRHEMQKLDGLIVLSHYDRLQYEKELGLHPTVIYNPLTLNPQGEGSPTYHRFLSVGRMSPLTKGFDLLIEAFASIADKHPLWKLDIVGEGAEEDNLRKQIANLGLEERITLHPFTKEIQKHYASASVYVLSSRWEGFGLVLIEAMGHRLPIIASNLPIVHELLGEKGNALTFDKGNANALAKQMDKIAGFSPAKLQEMGAISFGLAETYKLPGILQQWEKFITQQSQKTI